jgi:hypothetical protein
LGAGGAWPGAHYKRHKLEAGNGTALSDEPAVRVAGIAASEVWCSTSDSRFPA